MKVLTQCCGRLNDPPPGTMMLSCISARISVMTAAPASEPMIVPKPPKIEPPPMITEAIASSSRNWPATGLN